MLSTFRTGTQGFKYQLLVNPKLFTRKIRAADRPVASEVYPDSRLSVQSPHTLGAKAHRS